MAEGVGDGVAEGPAGGECLSRLEGYRAINAAEARGAAGDGADRTDRDAEGVVARRVVFKHWNQYRRGAGGVNRVV